METVDVCLHTLNAVSCEICATIVRIDATDAKILQLLTEDGRRTYGDIGRHVSLSSPAVKRRRSLGTAPRGLGGAPPRTEPTPPAAAPRGLSQPLFPPRARPGEPTAR